MMDVWQTKITMTFCDSIFSFFLSLFSASENEKHNKVNEDLKNEAKQKTKKF